jgi:hypothetical protein
MSSLAFALLAFGTFAALTLVAVLHLRAASRPTRPMRSEVLQRRQSPRRAVRKRALIWSLKDHARIRCRILNLSTSGAMLAPINITLCPGEFVLRPYLGKRRFCRVVWRDATTMGVRFLGPKWRPVDVS